MRPTRHRTPARVLSLLSVVLLAGCALVAAEERVPSEPRTLVLALDGVPYDAAVEAWWQGAFRGWPGPAALVAPFPSMTNVSFTAILEPFGVEPIEGYEVRRFDVENNDMVGGVFDYQPFPWKKKFDLYSRSLPAKAKDYIFPDSSFRAMMGKVDELVLESEEDLLFAYILATDNIGHYRGGGAVTPFLVDLSEHLVELTRRHEERFGRSLRIVMFSDHGNTDNTVYHCDGLKKRLRKAGLRVKKRLKKANDVVMPTFGVVSYVALFLHPEWASTAARAVVAHPGVDLAAWVSGAETLTVLSDDGEARIRWRDGTDGRWFAYAPVEGDPLLLAEERARLATGGSLAPGGFATAADWFAETALSEYPDPLRRLVDSLTGTHVVHSATVILSLEDGSAVGLPTARLGAGLRAGHLGGTHGALDRASTLGFYATNDPAFLHGPAVQASDALRELALLRQKVSDSEH